MQKHLPFSVTLAKVVEEEERCLHRTESGDSGGIIKSWTAVKRITKGSREKENRHRRSDTIIMIFIHPET